MLPSASAIFTLLCLFVASIAASQSLESSGANHPNPINYHVSFENADHHEAKVSVIFSNLGARVLEARMSRTSPGRYALHEFAKNVYGVHASDSQGNPLSIERPNPHQWNIGKHDGTESYAKLSSTK